MKTELQNKAYQAAILGLEFLRKNQISDLSKADCGRYPFVSNCKNGTIDTYTTNWLTGVVTSILVAVYRSTKDESYLENAKLSVSYLKTLQNFAPENIEVYGAMHEETAQGDWAHPRDGVTGAWGMLDYALLTEDNQLLNRVKIFADWFVNYGFKNDYPLWTIRFDKGSFEPNWFGSFHSGSAYFLTKAYKVFKDKKYLDGARKILDFYNNNILDLNGMISVITEHESLHSLDDVENKYIRAWAPIGWIKMHKYNDDFGALANLYYGDLTKDKSYSDKALLFLDRMYNSQHPKGGFGPAEWECGIPSGSGAVLIELLNAKKLGLLPKKYDKVIDNTVEHLINQQFVDSSSPVNGAFHGMGDDYTINQDVCNSRAGAYAVLALLQYSVSDICAYSV